MLLDKLLMNVLKVIPRRTEVSVGEGPDLPGTPNGFPNMSANPPSTDTISMITLKGHKAKPFLQTARPDTWSCHRDRRKTVAGTGPSVLPLPTGRYWSGHPDRACALRCLA